MICLTWYNTSAVRRYRWKIQILPLWANDVFLLSLSIFLKAKAEEEAKQKEEAYKNSTEGLLKEIRDLLKENKAVGEAENKAENGAKTVGKNEDR